MNCDVRRCTSKIHIFHYVGIYLFEIFHHSFSFSNQAKLLYNNNNNNCERKKCYVNVERKNLKLKFDMLKYVMTFYAKNLIRLNFTHKTLTVASTNEMKILI